MPLKPTAQATSAMLLEYWTQFSNGDSLSNWPKYGTQRNVYEIFTATQTEILLDYSGRRFWSEVEKLNETTVPTPAPTSPPTTSGDIVFRPMCVLHFLVFLGMVNDIFTR